MNNKIYVKRIVIIILLTNVPAILSLPLFYKEALGWISGSIASFINFIWLADNVKKSMRLLETKSKLNAVKGTLLRLLFLAVYSVVIVYLLRPNIVVFGLGLLSAQICIYGNEIYENIKKSKYF